MNSAEPSVTYPPQPRRTCGSSAGRSRDRSPRERCDGSKHPPGEPRNGIPVRLATERDHAARGRRTVGGPETIAPEAGDALKLAARIFIDHALVEGVRVRRHGEQHEDVWHVDPPDHAHLAVAARCDGSDALDQ